MIFERIKNKGLMAWYINEAWAICLNILDESDALIKYTQSMVKKKTKENKRYLISQDIRVHSMISSILSQASRLQKLVMASNKKKGEAQEEYDLRKKRAKFLHDFLIRGTFNKKHDIELLKTETRNSIEHFDDRLDKLFLAVSNNNCHFKNKTCILYNMVLSSREFIIPWDTVFPAKLYVIEENNYYHVNHNMNIKTTSIGKIIDECRKIAKFIKTEQSKSPDSKGQFPTKPVGIMVIAKPNLSEWLPS